MSRTYKYISADSHLEVPFDRWTHRVPAQYRDRAPRVVQLPEGGDAWVVEGRPLYYVGPDICAKPYEEWAPYGVSYSDSAGTGPPEQRLREQDADGVDAEVLFASVLSHVFMRSINDDAAYLAVLRAWNDWVVEEYCAVDPDRLLSVGLIPTTGIESALAELEHCARSGMKAVTLFAYPSSLTYPTPDDDRFWAAVIDADMPLTIHVQMGVGEGGGPSARNFKYEIEPKQMTNILSQGIVSRVARYGIRGALNVTQLTMSGVFDRFPKLRVYMAENQIGWIPHFLEQADTQYQRHRHWAERLLGFKPLSRLPSEYIREHVSWGLMYNPVGVQLRHMIGVDKIMWT
ncbi:MAG: amidohydrolase family protein, partial [Dehalococcoidia bacterium]